MPSSYWVGNCGVKQDRQSKPRWQIAVSKLKTLAIRKCLNGGVEFLTGSECSESLVEFYSAQSGIRIRALQNELNIVFQKSPTG
jgi:hypothetical protein